MTHYIQPYRTDKNIGKAINDAINQLQAPLTDWICLTDHDCMFLLPDSKAQLEHILSKTDYHILGATTNRLASNVQLIPNTFTEDSITKHIEIAQHQQNHWYEHVTPKRDILAAFCLCFTVKTWQNLGQFKEKIINFDAVFCAMAINRGYKLGIMKGIYLLHLYRWGTKNPAKEHSHLLPRPNQD